MMNDYNFLGDLIFFLLFQDIILDFLVHVKKLKIKNCHMNKGGQSYKLKCQWIIFHFLNGPLCLFIIFCGFNREFIQQLRINSRNI
jgi:hypothetical protein